MKKIIAIALILSFLSNWTLLAAPAITDVATGHWAHGAIRAVVNAGHMGVNAAGEFRPDAPIDKFETSRILASVLGQTPALLDQAHTTHRAVIEARAAQYTRWNNASNREIAFLISRGVYTESDLGNFIVRTGDVENLRALSRQEVAVYLVRLMGRGEAARASNFPHDFADNARINAAFRPYVYYLRNLGVIAGEPGNNFNPNGMVTRTTLAVLLNRVDDIMGQSGSPSVPPQQPPAAMDSISGSIEQIHVHINTLQIRLTSGEMRIIPLASTANIFVDGLQRGISDLREGMHIVAITQSNAITSLQAQTAASAPGTPNPPPQQPPQTFVEYRQIKGTVYAINQSTITVEMRILDPHGFITTQRENIVINNQTTLLRSGTAVTISNISLNDVVHVVSRNGVATRFELFERDRHMHVTVVDRRTESVLGTNYFVVEDRQGVRHELVVGENSRLRRQGATGNVRFRDIRIGDTLDLIAEYSLIVEAYAYGSRGSAEGVISEITISRAGSSVVIVESNGRAMRYHVRDGAFDIHAMRLNSRVHLWLDSLEIEGFTVLR